MSTEKSVREVVEKWNANAKAKGVLIEQDPWSLPALYDGSIVDVPMTPEADERIRRLDALIARLEQENAGAATAEQRAGSDKGQHATVSTSAAHTEATVNTTKS